MPWNFPLWQVVRFAARRSMLGNVGLLKHRAERCPDGAGPSRTSSAGPGLPEGVFTNLFVESKDIAAPWSRTRASPP